MRRIAVALIAILLVGGSALVGAWFLGNGTDAWRCENGQWVKEGNPREPMPSEGCGSGGQDTNRKEAMGAFSDGQPYASFSTDEFSVKYPFWPSLDPKDLASLGNVRVAVANAGCTILVSVTPVPADTTFKEYTEKLLQQRTEQMGVTVTVQDIQNTTAHVEGETTVQGVSVKSVSYGYFTGTRTAYSIAFMAASSDFVTSCEPFINETIGSVVVR